MVTAQDIKRLGLDPKHSWLPPFLALLCTNHPQISETFLCSTCSLAWEKGFRKCVTHYERCYFFSKVLSFPLQEDLLLLTGFGKHAATSLPILCMIFF